MKNKLYDEDFLKLLLSMHDQDPDKFMDLVMEVIRNNPELVVNDESSPEKKALALSRIREHYVEKEEYENCAIIKELEERIDGKK